MRIADTRWLQLVFFSIVGYYCVPELSVEGNSASAKNICPIGYFCPNGTGHNWQPCPAGTYGNSQGLKKAEDCTPCTGGQYCEGTDYFTTYEGWM